MTYLANRYSEFTKQYGYFPLIFNAWNKRDIRDITPSVIASCGNPSSINGLAIVETYEKRRDFLRRRNRRPIKENIKVYSMFSGAGAFEESLIRLGANIDLKAYAEVDKFASTVYSAIYNEDENKNLGDVTKINYNKDLFGDVELITGGSPCFKAGTLITTDQGLKKIEDIEKGDMVLTHKNRFREVVKPMINYSNHLFKLKIQGSPTTYVTGNHPYYIREMKEIKDASGKIEKVFGKAKWKEVKDLGKNDYIGVTINQKREDIKDIEIWLDGDFYEDGIVWLPFKEKELVDYDGDVYNFEVKEDNSYIANSCIVHNCQDFSMAGKRAGSVYLCNDCGYSFNPLFQHFSERGTCCECGSKNIKVTRSSLLVEYLRAIREVRPKYFIYENVKGLMFKNFKPGFDVFNKELQAYGYKTFYKVLNAKEHGIPQNRERVFVIGIRNDIKRDYVFPERYDLGLRLRDFLDRGVEDKYYIKDERVDKLLKEYTSKKLPFQKFSYCIDSNYHKGTNIKGFIEKRRRQLISEKACMPCNIKACKNNVKRNLIINDTESKENKLHFIGGVGEGKFSGDFSQGYRVYDSCGIATAFCSNGGGLAGPTGMYLVPENEIQMIEINQLVRVRKHEVNKDELVKCLRKYKKESKLTNRQIEPKIACDFKCYNLIYRVRKLTPLECWRLMGFTDESYWTARRALEKEYYNGGDRSNSQMYKIAGNSIVVDVLMDIFEELFALENIVEKEKSE